MSGYRHLSCAEVDELAGLYVLDALDPDDANAVSAHLASCSKHASMAELATASAELGTAVEPVAAPAGMRDRVLAAIAATPQEPDATILRDETEIPAEPATVVPLADAAGPSGRSWWGRLADPEHPQRRGGLAMPALAVAAVLVLVVAVGGLLALQDSGDDPDALALLRRAVAAAADPEATVAVLAGSEAAAGAAGYAVFEDGDGFIVIDGLPPTDAEHVYQAWLIGEGDPSSAGLLTVTDDGLGTLTGIDPSPDTAVVALSIEERPGAEAPTTTPVVVGEIRAATG